MKNTLLLLILISIFPPDYASAFSRAINVEGGSVFTITTEPEDCSDCSFYITNLKLVYALTDSVNVIAIPGLNYYFSHWESQNGQNIGPGAYVSFGLVEIDWSIRAVFKKIPIDGDFDGDGKIGVQEAINALQITAGMR